LEGDGVRETEAERDRDIVADSDVEGVTGGVPLGVDEALGA
jgi:hypothetical protein